jgi:predicted HTH domain antitoxin
MITIGEQTESKLREILGNDLERVAGEALIAEAYRTGKLSIGQAARLLSIPIHDAYGFMKNRGIAVNYTLDDFDSDCDNLVELRNQTR